MNERIRELYKNVLASSENMRWNIEDAEKFAELIARECLSYAKEGDLDFMKFMIKQNFGVEE